MKAIRLLRRNFSLNKLNHIPIFYKKVTVSPDPDSQNFLVQLDGRTPKTSDGHKLKLPSQTLAEIIKHEFELQQDYIIITTMPIVTQFLISLHYLALL